MLNDIGEMSFEKLQDAVLKSRERKKPDAPKVRLTKSTFPASFGILEWVSRGELRKAVEHFNNGGYYDWGTSVSWPREFWLARIFDAMEDLGKANFEKFVPGLWDCILSEYEITFSRRLEKKATE